MPTLDSTAAAQLAQPVTSTAWFIWIGINGDDIRVTNFGSNVTFASTGDSDLDGNTFVSFGGQFLQIGDVSNSESGSDTLTITLSGIVSLDTALLAKIGDPTQWQGRTCRIWFQLYDETGTTAQGAIVQHYTGYMSAVSLIPGRDQQTIQVQVENYLAAFNQASNRTYLRQSDYDAADTSAAATIAAANGQMRGGVGTQAASAPAGGGAGTISDLNRLGSSRVVSL